MTRERWQQIEHLYHSALEYGVNERAAFLHTSCLGDDVLHREVELLLQWDARAEHFIEAPALAIAAQLQSGEQSQSEQSLKIYDAPSPIQAGASLPEFGSPYIAPIFIGEYRIIRKLGEGGMGIVYEAEQQHPRRLVALKVIRGGQLFSESKIKQFQREVRALARLKHIGIAAIYESGSADDNQYYFAMELVRGAPLLDYVKGGRHTCTQTPLGIRQRLELFLKLCDAISYAHQRGVIHCDLKPANILVADEPEWQSIAGSLMNGSEIKVLDFGLARVIDEDGTCGSSVSKLGLIKGTLPYMSPEQISGDPGKIDVRTDVYTLGVILYELLTERFPYEVERTSLPQAIRVICEETPKPPSRMWSETRDRESKKTERVDRDLETIVLKALEKDPERRYQSAAAMGEDVGRYLTNRPINARPPSAFYQFRKLIARHKTPFALLAIVFMLLLGFTAMLARQSARIANERDKAVAAERAATEQRDAAEHARNSERKHRDATEQARNAEQEQRLLAEANLMEADEQRIRAEHQGLLSRRLLYAAHMNLAMQAWEALDIGRMQELIESHIPKPGEEDMRGFEWRYLWRRLYYDRLLIVIESEDQVNASTFSPDGKQLATGRSDKTVKLWNVATGREIATLKGHIDAIYSLAFSSDGKKLASGSGSADRTVKLWDTATGLELATLKGHGHRVLSIAFSPDGKKVASGCYDRSVKLWDTSSGRELATLKHGHAVWAVAFSPDGKMLVSGSEDREVKLWNVDTGQELVTLKGHGDAIYSLAFSPDGKKVASGSKDRTVKLWDAAAGRELVTLKGHGGAIFQVMFSPDGKRLASRSIGDRTLKVWDTTTGQELATFKGHAYPVYSVAFAPDGKHLASGSWDSLEKIWNADPHPELTSLKGHANAVLSVAFSPDGKTLASASGDETVNLWDSITGSKLVTVRSGYWLLSVAFSPDGKRLASAGDDRTVKLWDAVTGRELATLIGHGHRVYSVVFSPDGKRLASGSQDGTVKLWDADTGQELSTLKGGTSGVASVVFSPDGKQLASGCWDGTVILWDAVSGRQLATLNGHGRGINSVGFSLDGKRLASGHADGTVILWDVASGRQLATLKGHGRTVYSVVFSPDGKRLASGGQDRTVKLWNVATGQELATLKGHEDTVSSVAFSPDGNRLASGSYDRTVRFWNAATEKEVLTRSKQ
jgi:WD40 repeat protein/serine/threonine protein kinase